MAALEDERKSSGLIKRYCSSEAVFTAYGVDDKLAELTANCGFDQAVSTPNQRAVLINYQVAREHQLRLRDGEALKTGLFYAVDEQLAVVVSSHSHQDILRQPNHHCLNVRLYQGGPDQWLEEDDRCPVRLSEGASARQCYDPGTVDNLFYRQLAFITDFLMAPEHQPDRVAIAGETELGMLEGSLLTSWQACEKEARRRYRQG